MLEKVKAACGHEVDFPHFDPAKDRYRQKRRDNVTGKKCHACRQQDHQERMRLQQEAAAKRPKKKKDGPGRLPHGSVFAGPNGLGGPLWDQTKNRWFGSLLVPGYPVFEAEHSAVFRLLIKLDKMFRQAEKERIKNADSQALPAGMG